MDDLLLAGNRSAVNPPPVKLVQGSGDVQKTNADCTPYPIVFSPDPAARQRAVNALATLAPNASMQWDDDRGTLSSIANFEFVLNGCEEQEDVYSFILPVIEANPDLFQIEFESVTTQLMSVPGIDCVVC